MPPIETHATNLQEEIVLAEDFEEISNSNDIAVLKAIGDDIENVSFQGIRRKLGLHQEIVSRALHRLRRDGFIEKTEHSYRLSEKGLAKAQGIVKASFQNEDQQSIPVLRAMLLPGTKIQDLAASLSYKWFGNLRWLGSTVGHDYTTLTWMTSENDIRVSAKIRKESITIETSSGQEEDRSEAIRAAYNLFDHITKIFKDESHIPTASRYATAA